MAQVQLFFATLMLTKFLQHYFVFTLGTILVLSWIRKQLLSVNNS